MKARIYLENTTRHTETFGQRVFRVYPEQNNATEYAYAKDVKENYDRARWYGFNANMPRCLQVCSLSTAVDLAD